MPTQRKWRLAIRQMERTIALLDEIATSGSRDAMEMAGEVQGARDRMVIRFRRVVRTMPKPCDARSFSGLAEGMTMFRDMVKASYRPPR